ncbi:unnamed protein product [Rhodiola kirilowii]
MAFNSRLPYPDGLAAVFLFSKDRNTWSEQIQLKTKKGSLLLYLSENHQPLISQKKATTGHQPRNLKGATAKHMVLQLQSSPKCYFSLEDDYQYMYNVFFRLSFESPYCINRQTCITFYFKF